MNERKPWRIELLEGPLPWMGEVLGAQLIWRRLSPAARAAVEAAYPDGVVAGHPGTLAALKRHGFTYCGRHSNFAVVLTEAGKAVARWNVGKKP